MIIRTAITVQTRDARVTRTLATVRIADRIAAANRIACALYAPFGRPCNSYLRQYGNCRTRTRCCGIISRYGLLMPKTGSTLIAHASHHVRSALTLSG